MRQSEDTPGSSEKATMTIARPDASFSLLFEKNYRFRRREREKRTKSLVIARINNPAGFLGGSR